jgi:hypothetical protein
MGRVKASIPDRAATVQDLITMLMAIDDKSQPVKLGLMVASGEVSYTSTEALYVEQYEGEVEIYADGACEQDMVD